LAQEAQSKVRCEKTVVADVPHRGFLDALRNSLSFAATPLLHSPQRDGGGRYDRFCSSASTARGLTRLDVKFLAIACIWARSDFN
jgi:hypothetical protein